MSKVQAQVGGRDLRQLRHKYWENTQRLEALLRAGDWDPTMPSVAQAGNHPLWAPTLTGGGEGSTWILCPTPGTPRHIP